MIEHHYIRTICRYVDELARKNDLMVHTGATPELLREIGVLSLTIKNLADVANVPESER
jgi:transposase